MKARITTLALLLAGQLALAAYLGVGRPDAPPAPVALSLPAAEAVEAITIAPPAGGQQAGDDTDAPGAAVSLLRREDRWELAEPAGLPADAARIDGLLTTLAGLRPGPPVADSAAARRRFAVAKNRYERRITLQTAEGEQVLYLGTPAGIRRAHLRAAGDDAIHRVALALIDVPADADGWLDKTLLQLPAATIAAIDVAGLQLTRDVPPADTDTADVDAAAESTHSAANHASGAAQTPATAAGARTDHPSPPRPAGDAGTRPVQADAAGPEIAPETADTANHAGTASTPAPALRPVPDDAALAAAASDPAPGAPEAAAASTRSAAPPTASPASSDLPPPGTAGMPPAEALAGARASGDNTGPAGKAGGWRGVRPGTVRPVPVSGAATDELVQRIAGLRVAGLTRQAPSGEATLRFSVTRSDGSARTYRLFAPPAAPPPATDAAPATAPAADADYRLTVSDSPHTFRVPAFLAEPLVEAATPQRLLATRPGQRETATDGSQAAP